MKPEEIRARLKASGRSAAQLGRHLGKKRDSMSRLLSGDRRMTAEELQGIREFFEADNDVAPQYETIDVYGYAAAGGTDRVAMGDGRAIDRIEIPAGLVRGPTIGIRVVGDSMEPRLFSGETVIVGMNVPPGRDRDCVVELMDGTAMVKTYRGSRDGWVFLHQYNPDEEVKVGSDKVRAIHAVLYRR
jgi:phage repressor protein C with HTH and peptisase S24 domain